MRISAEIRRSIWWLIAAAAAGALAGALAGWWAAGWTVEVGGFISSSTGLSLQFRTATGTPPFAGGGVTVIPIENRPPAVVLPPPFAERGASSAAALYRRLAQKKTDDGLLTEDRLLGQAAAVTSDGWFAAVQSELDGLRPAEVIVWHNGKAATATRAVIDRLSGVVFLKTGLSGLPAPRLAGAREVSQNAAVWLERQPRRFEAASVASLSDPAANLDGVSSEAALRRPALAASSGGNAAGDLGAPVWSTDGSLLGLVSPAEPGGLRFISAASWSPSLQSLLVSGEIRHAYLGVRSVDLSFLRLESPPFGLPARGAWLKDDKRNKKPAVERNSPAATAGLRAGDVIQSIDRDIIDESADLAELLAGYKPGSRVTLTVLRGGQTLEIPVILGSMVTSEEIR